MHSFQIILAGSLVAISCGLLGCYLILRKMAMLGDAISHAVLPGIVLAFLFTGSRDSVTMLIGAGLIGILTTFLIEYFHKRENFKPMLPLALLSPGFSPLVSFLYPYLQEG